jgi:hypothetical protein
LLTVEFTLWHSIFIVCSTINPMAKKKTNLQGEKQEFPGYPHYPEGQDIFNKESVDYETDPDNPTSKKTSDVPGEGRNEKDFRNDVSGSDLDIPGAEIDDAQEDIGSEDEENNYYSLGGDNHETQEEQGAEPAEDQST